MLIQTHFSASRLLISLLLFSASYCILCEQQVSGNTSSPEASLSASSSNQSSNPFSDNTFSAQSTLAGTIIAALVAGFATIYTAKSTRDQNAKNNDVDERMKEIEHQHQLKLAEFAANVDERM